MRDRYIDFVRALATEWPFASRRAIRVAGKLCSSGAMDAKVVYTLYSVHTLGLLLVLGHFTFMLLFALPLVLPGRPTAMDRVNQFSITASLRARDV